MWRGVEPRRTRDRHANKRFDQTIRDSRAMLDPRRGAPRIAGQTQHVGLHVRRREPSALADLRSVFGEAKSREASSR